MSEHQAVGQMLDRAERAATDGDLASADELLREAARIQEEDLGPLHPDLANTLNNLAIVAERTGRTDEAEAFYRRAVAIASASLPPDDPMVAESRRNFEDFCHARGLPIELPPVTAATRDTGQQPEHPAAGHTAPPAGTAAAVPAADRITTASAAPRSSALPVVDSVRAPVDSRPEPPSAPPEGRSHRIAWLATVVVVIVAVVLLARGRRSSRGTSTTAPPSPAAAQSADAVPPSPPATLPKPAPIEQAGRPPNAASDRNSRNGANTEPPAPAPRSGSIALAEAELCRSFRTSGRSWRCDPVGSSVAPGPLVLYTRVRSVRDASVVHRWYRGNMLRQSVTLPTRANATEGYRTYSRLTVDAGEWRVEVRSTNGTLLREQRFAVR